MNVVTVRINEVEYNLKGNEKEEYLHRVANYVNKTLKNIMDNNSKLSTSSAAVLTALNAADELLKKTDEMQQLLDKLDEFEDEKRKLHREIERLTQKVSQLEATNEELQNKSVKDDYEDMMNNKNIEIDNIRKEKESLQAACKKYLDDNNMLKAECKEFKFQVQSSKYKIMDLQHRLIETQMELAKEKKTNHPLLNK